MEAKGLDGLKRATYLRRWKRGVDLHFASKAWRSSPSRCLCIPRVDYFGQYLVVPLKYGIGFNRRRIRGYYTHISFPFRHRVVSLRSSKSHIQKGRKKADKTLIACKTRVNRKRAGPFFHTSRCKPACHLFTLLSFLSSRFVQRQSLSGVKLEFGSTIIGEIYLESPCEMTFGPILLLNSSLLLSRLSSSFLCFTDNIRCCRSRKPRTRNRSPSPGTLCIFLPTRSLDRLL